VLMNLVVNARDAMPTGGELIIETSNVELDEAYVSRHPDTRVGRHVMLTVTDTGAGMSSEVMERIFEPFYTTKDKGLGTGLGLSTVYGIVRQSEGNIGVTSEVGRGTTFRVVLPRVDAKDIPRRPAAGSSEVRGNETVLIVEDEQSVRKLTSRILRSAGYNVVTAANGGEALLECERSEAEIDLVLTDVVMPRMSGKELVDRLAKVLPAVRVLYMSGYTNNAIAQHGVLDEGVHFIAKPFHGTDLLSKVRAVLDDD